MFSGIISHTGKFVKISQSDDQWILEIEAELWGDLNVSESISVNGACLTLVYIRKETLLFNLLHETYEVTNLSKMNQGDLLNLERSLRLGDRLGGHFLTGHVDGQGSINKIINLEREVIFEIKPPSHLMKFIVPKGSIAVEGISLTVGKVYEDSFEVYLIPYTLNQTNLYLKKSGDTLNLEVDILARYAQGSRSDKVESRITEDFLKGHGFL